MNFTFEHLVVVHTLLILNAVSTSLHYVSIIYTIRNSEQRVLVVCVWPVYLWL